MKIIFVALFFLSTLFGTDMEKTLFDAVYNNDIKRLEQLIKQGVNINIQNQKKQSPIMVATYNNNIKMVEMLFKNGADVNLQDDYKNTPFLYAGATGQLEILKIIYTKADAIKPLNRYGGNALIPACEKGHVEVVEFLLKNTSVEVNHINNLGWTALLEVVILGDDTPEYAKIVKILVENGADIYIKDHKGKDALYYAKKNKMFKILKVLENP